MSLSVLSLCISLAACGGADTAADIAAAPTATGNFDTAAALSVDRISMTPTAVVDVQQLAESGPATKLGFNSPTLIPVAGHPSALPSTGKVLAPAPMPATSPETTVTPPASRDASPTPAPIPPAAFPPVPAPETPPADPPHRAATPARGRAAKAIAGHCSRRQRSAWNLCRRLQDRPCSRTSWIRSLGTIATSSHVIARSSRFRRRSSPGSSRSTLISRSRIPSSCAAPMAVWWLREAPALRDCFWPKRL